MLTTPDDHNHAQTDDDSEKLHRALLQPAAESAATADDATAVPVYLYSATEPANDLHQTPVIAESSGTNDTFQTAQSVDRALFAVAANPNLPDDTQPSATISGTISENG